VDKLILHIDADAFFASVEQGYNPKLLGKPVIVGGLSHQRGCVHTSSYEARRLGVHTGMPLRQAKEICPDAIFLKGDFRHYRTACQQIKEILYTFSPDVEMASIDDAYVDATHVIRHFTSPVIIAERIQQEIRHHLNIGVSIGIATSKLVARIASGMQKPLGITFIQPGDEQQFLSVLPLRKLRGIGRKTEAVFKDLGVTTIGMLARMPKTTVLQLLGPIVGETIWQYANANDTRRVQVMTMPKQISRETSFEEDTDDAKLIHGTLQYLTERIAAKLRRNNLTAHRVHLKVYYAGGSSQKQSITLRHRTDDGQIIWNYLRTLYEKLPVKRIRVKLVGVTALNIDQKENQFSLFESHERRNDLNRSIDRIRERFGFTSLAAGSTLVLQNYYRMEQNGYILHTPALSQ